MRTFTIRRTGPGVHPDQESFTVERETALGVTVMIIARVAFDIGKWCKVSPVEILLWTVSEEREGDLMSFRVDRMAGDGGFVLYGSTKETNSWEVITILE